MPLYEFKCRKCMAEYEELLSSSETAPPPCPECRSEDVEKKMSVFGSTGGSHSGSCGSSGFS